MKKILICFMFLVLFTGCSNKEKTFEKYATTYYNNHMRMVDSVNSVSITLEDLRNASDEDGYDLKSLSKCDSQSSVTFNIDSSSKDIVDGEINLNC